MTNLPQINLPDFSVFGEREAISLNRIQKFAARAVTHSCLTIPHVTHQDEADITALAALRQTLNAGTNVANVSLLAFVLKVVALTLKAHPKLNASYDAGSMSVILKKYYNFGVAIDTPNGLLVGVIHGCDEKPIRDIATEIIRISSKTREKGLSIQENVRR